VLNPAPGLILLEDNVQLVRILLSSSLLIAFFYFINLWLAPKLINKNQLLLFFVTSIIILFVFIVFHKQFLCRSFFAVHGPHNPNQHFQMGFNIRIFLLYFIALGLFLLKKMKNNELERKKAELAFLKSQINPHFLFNTLNGIYAQAIINSEKTADSISQLSSLMRYIMTEANEEWVPLKKEINYIESYINLQRIRLTEKTTIIFNIEGNLEDKKIRPLILINFIENAFKYGVSTETDSDIQIEIKVLAKELQLFVANPIVSKKVESSEVGLKNVMERLKLTNPEQYNLKIIAENNQYKVWFKILLK
jgi:signal transduction histidine kinase